MLRYVSKDGNHCFRSSSVGEHQHPTFFAKVLVDQVELTLTDGSRNPSWRQQESLEGSVWICLNDFLEGTYPFFSK